MKRYVNGYEINSIPKSFSDPPRVTMARLGGGNHAVMTPAEARALATELNAAADEADRR